ncbi:MULTISPECIES: peptidoglycan-binding protein [unclassified Streptomyces]|uniref:peptidoglycan-binding protein n=1 Tax=unclassified Streptomyces TaxID=2593676 RepID=UPI00190B1E9E|nr:MULTISPECIES: peptidoglycan-binding protein [unclassified Streptomyces]MBK3563234.1 peptidoglycan-binding protein [Streptomyces sp. MBT62]MBK6013223.1 peptidoglycan-binding protein [Streptomyces sp. MBT53]
MKLVNRAQWGAKPSRYDLVYIASTNGVKIHYEGAYVAKSLADPDAHSACAGHMRDIQASHLANAKEDYSDIAYNAVVCPHGYVFEGRGLHRKTAANGNQPLNVKDYAVCAMVGSSGLVKPTDAQLGGLVDAIEWLRSGGAAGDEVLGHRDGYATQCPGDPLYAWVQAGAHRPDGTSPQGGTTGGTTIARYQVVINGLTYGYGATGAHVTAVGKALVAKGFGRHYSVGPGPEWSDADTENFSDFQVSLGFTGTGPHEDADGVPGSVSLQRLLGTLPGKATTSAAPLYPGRSAFVLGKSNPAVTTLDGGLVRRGFTKHHASTKYTPGPLFSENTRLNVRDFQRSVPALAGAADGYPGPLTWRLLLS